MLFTTPRYHRCVQQRGLGGVWRSADPAAARPAGWRAAPLHALARLLRLRRRRHHRDNWLHWRWNYWSVIIIIYFGQSSNVCSCVSDPREAASSNRATGLRFWCHFRYCSGIVCHGYERIWSDRFSRTRVVNGFQVRPLWGASLLHLTYVFGTLWFYNMRVSSRSFPSPFLSSEYWSSAQTWFDRNPNCCATGFEGTTLGSEGGGATTGPPVV